MTGVNDRWWVSLCYLVASTCVGAVMVDSTDCSEVCDFYDWGKDAKCQGRDLEYVPQECRHAKTLRMEDNRVAQLVRGTFKNFTCLKNLYLNRNNLSLEAGAFEGCDMVEQIHLTKNHIPRVEAGMMTGLTNVLFMFVDAAGVIEVEGGAFHNMMQLQFLSLIGNKLKSPPCQAFTSDNSLTTLYLDSNLISNLPDGCFSVFHRLQKLFLKNNPLGALNPLAFQGLVSLDHLNLEFTGLTSVPTDTFPHTNSLTILNLSFNNITHLSIRDFSILTGLRKLYVQNNRLISIHGQAFEFLHSLEVLDLSNNNILSVGEGLLSGFSQLTDVRLHQNLLNSTRNISFGELRADTKIHLGENPLHCDFTICAFHYWLTVNSTADDTVRARPSFQARCATPFPRQRDLISNLQGFCMNEGEGTTTQDQISGQPAPIVGTPEMREAPVKQISEVHMIAIIAGGIVLIIILVGVMVCVYIRKRFGPGTTPKSPYYHGEEEKPKKQPHPGMLINITDNRIPDKHPPALPPRPQVYPDGRRSISSSTTTPPADGYISPIGFPHPAPPTHPPPLIDEQITYSSVLPDDDIDDDEDSMKRFVETSCRKPPTSPTTPPPALPPTGHAHSTTIPMCASGEDEAGYIKWNYT